MPLQTHTKTKKKKKASTTGNDKYIFVPLKRIKMINNGFSPLGDRDVSKSFFL